MRLEDPAPPRDRYDCVVVGAGPAGSMTARELARGGASVLLVDQKDFPRSKVCGCNLNPRALKTLERAGLGDLPAKLGAIPVRGIDLAAAGRRVRLGYPLGVTLSRDALDLALADEAVAAGAEFLPGTKAELLASDQPGDLPAGWAPPNDLGLGRPKVGGAHPTEQEGRSIRLHSGEGDRVVHAKAVVSATGLAGPLHDDPTDRGITYRPGSKIGAGVIAPEAPAGYDPGLIYMACGREGYVGVVVLEDGRLDLAAALCPDAVKASGGIGPLARSILGESGFPEVPGIGALPWRGTPRLTRTSSVIAKEGVYRVGDAAGYVEPFTGEGMAWALAGGVRLGAILMKSARESHAEMEHAWRVAYRRDIVRRQWVCRGASLALRTPWMTRGLLRLVGAAPGLARPVMRAMHRA